ncbi:Pyrazinamidase/nicotinamidase [Achlya hypogyna]|uniref:nicotinamidase n=1 Tax=Achlya hypogyna TaxID=1202772 RepID=A0A1V9YJL0_ACHHY|nr:Pyrazinamidase/nicotinamidase [Achlya hypogyna]
MVRFVDLARAAFVATLVSAQKTALIIVDMQNDFAAPTGSLSVAGGESIIPTINKLRAKGHWDLIVTTQDWHPKNHVSFYSTFAKEPNAKMYQPYVLPNGDEQVLWPDHCVQGSKGAEFHKDLVRAPSDVIIQKGMNVSLDSYSALLENDHATKTKLSGILDKAGVTHLAVTGLAFDYCVGSTAYDANTMFGYEVTLITDATASVASASQATMEAQLADAGITFKTADEYLKIKRQW